MKRREGYAKIYVKYGQMRKWIKILNRYDHFIAERQIYFTKLTFDRRLTVSIIEMIDRATVHCKNVIYAREEISALSFGNLESTTLFVYKKTNFCSKRRL